MMMESIKSYYYYTCMVLLDDAGVWRDTFFVCDYYCASFSVIGFCVLGDGVLLFVSLFWQWIVLSITGFCLYYIYYALYICIM